MELLGALPDPVKFVIVFLLILGVLAPLLWRRFSIGSHGHAGPRGRLSVVETAALDVRHRLVLVKRDNVEHLLLVGGATDIVVESNIARTPAAVREPRPIPDARAEAARQGAPAETPDWALEPAMARPVRTVDLDAALPEPAARTAREAMADSMRAVRSGAAARRGPPPDFEPPTEEVAAPALMPSPGEGHREGRQPPPEPVPPPAAEAAEPKRERPAPPRPVQPIPAAPAAARPVPVPPPAPAPSRQQQPPADESNFAEMTQRLEAALRRPSKPEPPPLPAGRPAPRQEPLRQEPPPAARKPAPADAAGPAKPSVKSPDATPPDLKVLPSGKARNDTALDSLEDEMARMLGRPGKS
jgi:flagellar protein FliO/FliZ